MLMPPILSKRQSELIPYIISGCTRKETASAMKISEETVRLHTRNLLKKFHATNVRDCMEQLISYDKVYGSQSPGHRIYVERFFVHMDIKEKTFDSAYLKEQEITVVTDSLHALTDKFETRGVINEVLINDKPVEPKKLVTWRFNVEETFDPPYKAGEQFKRKVFCRTSGSYTEDVEWVGFECLHPTGELEFKVTLPEDRPAKNAWLCILKQNFSVDLSLDFISADNRLLSTTIREPELGADYKLFWEW